MSRWRADADLRTQRAELRMNAYATHGGVDKRRFELFALAAGIVGKCHFFVASHYQTLKEIGMSAVQLRDVGRIAAAVNAAAQVLGGRCLRPVVFQSTVTSHCATSTAEFYRSGLYRKQYDDQDSKGDHDGTHGKTHSQ